MTVIRAFAGLFQRVMCYGCGVRAPARAIPRLQGISRQFGGDPARRPAGRGSDSVPTATRSAPARSRSRPGGRTGHRPCRRSGPRRARDLARPGRARPRGPPGPDTPPVPPPSHGRPAAADASPSAQRVDQRDGVGAVRPRPPRRRGRRRSQLGVSLTISGLAVQRPDCVEQRRRLARVGAHDQPGLDVRAGDVELERGDLLALGERAPRASPTSSRVKPMTLTISGTGSSASCGRSCAR